MRPAAVAPPGGRTTKETPQRKKLHDRSTRLTWTSAGLKYRVAQIRDVDLDVRDVRADAEAEPTPARWRDICMIIRDRLPREHDGR